MAHATTRTGKVSIAVGTDLLRTDLAVVTPGRAAVFQGSIAAGFPTVPPLEGSHLAEAELFTGGSDRGAVQNSLHHLATLLEAEPGVLVHAHTLHRSKHHATGPAQNAHVSIGKWLLTFPATAE